MPNGELEKYYNYLKSKKVDVPPTYESFSKTLEDKASAEKYFGYLKTKKVDVPDSFDSFSKTFNLGEKQPPKETKEPSMFSATPAEYTALGKGKTEDQKPLKIETRPTKEPLAKQGTYVRPDIAPLPPSKDVTKAVEETTNKRLRAKYTGGILFPKNSNAYKKEYNDVLKSYNNGVLVYEDGNLKQGTGFFESLGDSIVEKGKREANSYKINNVATSSELADILDDEREKQIMSTETEKTTKGVAGWVGKTLGEVGTVVGTSMAGTALAGGSPIGGIAAITLDTYYNTKAQKIKDIYYKELDRLESEGVKREDARIKAAEIAQSQSSLAAVPETLAMTGMALLPGASPTATAARKAFVELIKKPVSVGGIFALKVPAEKGIEEFQGRKAEWDKLTGEMTQGFADGVVMDIGFKIVGSPLHTSKVLRSAALNFLSKMPDNAVKAQAATQEGGDKVLAQVDAYKQANKKIGDSVTEDLEVPVTGKQVAIDKLEKEIEKQKADKVPDAIIKENELKLEALKKQQNDIIETGNVTNNEINNITGEPIGEKTLNDKRQEQYDVLADLASKNPNFKFTETFEEFNKNIDANPNYLSEVYDKSAPYVTTGELKEIGGTKEAFINYLTEKPTEVKPTETTPTEPISETEQQANLEAAPIDVRVEELNKIQQENDTTGSTTGTKQAAEGTTGEVPSEPKAEIISDTDITTAESKLGGTESARKQYDADQQGFMGDIGETYEQFLRRKLC
jgi:hypothetical protein